MRAFRGRFLFLLCMAVMSLTAATLTCGAQMVSQPVASGGDAAAVQQIKAVINDYKKAVDTLDLSIVRKIWSSGEVTFIHPHGTEYGLDQIIENVYGKAMGAYSKRELLPETPQIHVYGDTAWSEFAWTFHGTAKSDGQNVTSKGHETQIYRKENGSWRIVHIHYSGARVNGS